MKRREANEVQGKPAFEQLEQRLLLSGTDTAIELFNISPALFVENQGQWAESSLRYVHNGNNANVGMTDTGALFQVFRSEASDEDSPQSVQDHLIPDDAVTQMLQFSASFVDANLVIPIGLDPSAAKFNYFLGDQANWQSDVPSYEMVGYEQLYDGVDLYTWGQRDSLKYEFHVTPGADYQQITIHYEGIEGLSIDEDGSLLVDLGGDWGQLTDDTPYIYQEIDGERVEVAGTFEVLDANTYAFNITGDYDSSVELIIDPDLSWATYLGGSTGGPPPGLDAGYGITVDSAGNALVTGSTNSSDFFGANNTYRGGNSDAFVAKVTPGGSLAWASYLGGSEYEYGRGIVVDTIGNTLVTGYTLSSDFSGANNSIHGGGDAFVAKVSSSGSLLWSSYLGGSGNDEGLGITVDSAGNALVTGSTNSSDFSGANNTYHGGDDAFVAKVNSSGSLSWASYLGGSGGDYGWGITVDYFGNTLVTGETNSSDFSGANNTYHGGSWDAFVAKVTPGGVLSWASYLGGRGSYGIAVDSAGNALVTGHSGSYHAFVAKVTPGGSLSWASYLGGSGYDYGRGIAVDSAGNALVTGYTSSSNFSGANNAHYGGSYDAFVAKVSSSGLLSWASFLGGSGADYGYGIAVDTIGNALVTGYTYSSDFFGANNTNHGASDAFVAKISGTGGAFELADLAISESDIVLTPQGDDQLVTATVYNYSSVAASNILVKFWDLETETVIGTDVIALIGAQGSDTASTIWTPAGYGSDIEIRVDPDNAIQEVSKLNNTAEAVYGAAGGDPIVTGVMAAWDANGDADTFGRFVADIELWNTFTATADDPDGAANVDYVTFTLGALGPVTDSDSYGGWTADFDMGQLSSDTSLSVVAYDDEGHASTPWTGTVHVVPFPSWMGTSDEDDYFGDGHYYINDFFPDQLNISNTIDPAWWIIGGKTSELKLGVELGLVAGLDSAYDVPIDHEFVFEAKILDQEIFGFSGDPFSFSPGSGVSLSFSGLADGDDLSLAGLSGNLTLTDLVLFEGSVPEISYTVWVPVGFIPIPVRVALGMNLGMELDGELNLGLNAIDGTVEILAGTYFEPTVTAEPYIFGGLGIDMLNIGLEAGGELGLHYRGEYNSVDGYNDYSWGTFQINLRAIATAGKKYTLATWTQPSDGPWTFGSVPPGEVMVVPDEPTLPDILPWPNVAADSLGNVLLTRVVDLDADPGEIDPEIFYAIRDLGGTWSALNPVATNELIESDPDAAFDGLGGAIVSWVLNTIDPALVESTDYDVYLQTQEIYSSYFNGTSWSTPQVVTSDSEMDGGPEVAFYNGQGLMLWEHAGGTGSMDLDGFEILYAEWDDATHTWGTPVALTSDTEGDWSPTVAFGPSGEAMAVWVHDDDSDPTTADLYYATWNGVSWSTAAAVPLSSTAGVREPRIAYDSNGDVLLAWVGNEGGADILYNSTWDHVSETWSTPEAISGTSGVIEGLDLDISNTDEAMIVWHGWDGQNDLFSTVRSLGGSDPWTPPARITDNAEGEWMLSTAFDSEAVPVTVWANENVATIFGDGAEGIELQLVPDLEVTQVEVVSFDYIEGHEAQLTAEITNTGWADAAATTIQFYLGDPGSGGTAIGSPVAVAVLEPGSSDNLVSEAFVLPVGTNDYYAVVAAVAGEIETADNSKYVSLASGIPDVTGPQVTLDVPADGFLREGTATLSLLFDEPVITLFESDISLVESTVGFIAPEHVYLAVDGSSASLIFEDGLPVGSYTFKVLDSVVDTAGNALDGDSDSSPGGDYQVALTVAMLGDVNNDGFVGGGDLNTIISNWGLAGATHLQGDLTGEGDVGGADYNQVLAHWGEGIPPTPPEPPSEPLAISGVSSEQTVITQASSTEADEPASGLETVEAQDYQAAAASWMYRRRKQRRAGIHAKPRFESANSRHTNSSARAITSLIQSTIEDVPLDFLELLQPDPVLKL